MADLTYAQLKQQWLNNAKDTPYDDNDWASTMAAVAQAQKNPSAVSAAGVQQLSTQGVQSFDGYSSGAYKAFVNTATSPSPAPASADVAAAPLPAPGGVTPGQTVNPNIGVGLSGQISGSTDECLWRLSPLGQGGIAFELLGKPSWCILTKSNARALISGGIFVGGMLVLLFGVSKLLGTSSPAEWVKNLGTGAAAAAAPEAAPVIAATRQRPPPPPPPPARPAAQRQRGDASRYDYRRRENAQRLGPNA